MLKAAARSVAHVWSPAKSQLYAVLPRLARDGLVRGRSVAQSDRPDKQLYRLTAEGERALQAWLTTVEPEDVQGFHLRVFFGGLMPHDALVEHVQAHRELLIERLLTFDGIDEENTGRGHDWYHRLMLDLGYAGTRAALGWTEDVLSKLRRHR